MSDSARAVARRYYGDAVIDPPRDVAMYSAFVSGVLGDSNDLFRKLRDWFAVDQRRARSLDAEPGWFFRDYQGTPEWNRLVGRGP
jgi:hypothetical protein